MNGSGLTRWRVDTRQKLAPFLQAKVGGSCKGVRRLLEKNCCRVNGRIERFGSVWLEKGTVVEFASLEKKKNSFHTLFENEDLLIVDKPVGWVCDNGSCSRTFGSQIFLVHRLDKETTGALLLAKSSSLRDELMALFSSRLVEKEYLALVDGVPKDKRGRIENFLAKKSIFDGQTIWGASAKGDLAITDWEVMAEGNKASLIRCFPKTGRTHQIRVHLSEMGHPILVDRQYADRFRSNLLVPRPLLHAHRLKFRFKEREIEAKAPLPFDMREALLSVQMEMGHLGEPFCKKEHDDAGCGCENHKNQKEVE